MNMKTNANIIYCRVIQIVLCQTITIPIEGLWSKRAVKWFRVLWRKWTLKFTDLIYGKILLCSKFFDACTCHAKIAFLKEGAFFSPSCCCIFVLFCGWKQLIICVECVHTKWKMRIRLFFCEGKCQTWIHARCVNVNNERYAHLSDSEEKRECPCVRNTYLCFSKIITKSCNRTHNSHWCQEKFSFLAGGALTMSISQSKETVLPLQGRGPHSDHCTGSSQFCCKVLGSLWSRIGWVQLQRYSYLTLYP